jgi:hypothetical protein
LLSLKGPAAAILKARAPELICFRHALCTKEFNISIRQHQNSRTKNQANLKILKDELDVLSARAKVNLVDM